MFYGDYLNTVPYAGSYSNDIGAHIMLSSLPITQYQSKAAHDLKLRLTTL